MTKKAEVPHKGKAKTTNPISHVAYQFGDLSGVENAGGKTKEFIPITPEIRQVLRTAVAEASVEIERETALHPDIPGVLVIRLREDAIAKSHRPTELIYEAGMPPAGHGKLDEMLVAANAVSLSQLGNIISTRNTQKIRANISAVDGFEAWGIQRRLPKVLRGKSLSSVLDELIALNRRLMIRMFSHRSEATSKLVIEHLESLLDALGIGYTALAQRVGPPIYLAEMNGALTLEAFENLLHFQGVRQISPEPYVWPTATVATAATAATALNPTFSSAPMNALPVVAVFDTGVDPKTTILANWVISRDPYILPPETDYVHGTSVSSLIADGVSLNSSHPLFPLSACQIHDVCALESNGSRISDLILRLREAVSKEPDIKVWNLSLGANEISDDEFSDFGRELDALSDMYGILFIVASGNYVDLPRRGWPAPLAVLSDRISSPGDSVRSITVGSVTHIESAASLVKTGEPAPYSRRGPGPVFTPKPDIVHLGGNADVNLDSNGIGVNVLIPGGAVACLCGTSFASPLAASMAAHTWQALNVSGRVQPLNVTANMVKALLIHSAQINSPERTAFEKRYFGAGLPSDTNSILFDSDSSFTMLFELEIADTTKWRKSPFPIPPSLMKDGKLNCEVIITATYSPPLDPAAGSEYVRVNVDVGFGVLAPDKKTGKIQFKGQVPAEGELGTTGFEDAQIEHGGKWSPVKTYRRSFPKGKAGDTWALQASMVRRAFEPSLAQPLRVVIIVTLRALDDNPRVYEEGQRVLAETNWLTQNIFTQVPVSVTVKQ